MAKVRSAQKTKSRVNIVADLKLADGSMEKIELPFVMAVMANLSGKPSKDLPKVDKRKFEDFNHKNFNARLKAIQPRAAFQVKNTMGGQEGDMQVEVKFESMDDFKPDHVARNVRPLRHLLEKRTQLANLLAYIDGQEDAEVALRKLLEDRALLEAAASLPAPPSSGEGDGAGGGK